jgi:hypothetical protein
MLVKEAGTFNLTIPRSLLRGKLLSVFFGFDTRQLFAGSFIKNLLFGEGNISKL